MTIPLLSAVGEEAEDEEEDEDEEELAEEEVEGEEDAEEEAWLHALEAGKVNERGYLPEKRDSSSLTARQVRARVCTD